LVDYSADGAREVGEDLEPGRGDGYLDSESEMLALAATVGGLGVRWVINGMNIYDL
jgi:hypothetical protein